MVLHQRESRRTELVRRVGTAHQNRVDTSTAGQAKWSIARFFSDRLEWHASPSREFTTRRGVPQCAHPRLSASIRGQFPYAGWPKIVTAIGRANR